MKALELAGDVVAGSSAFAAVIIVYVSSVATAFGTYSKVEQRAVQRTFRRRALAGCVGVAMAAAAAAFALIGKWTSCGPVVAVGAVLMIATLLSGVLAAARLAWEIR